MSFSRWKFLLHGYILRNKWIENGFIFYNVLWCGLRKLFNLFWSRWWKNISFCLNQHTIKMLFSANNIFLLYHTMTNKKIKGFKAIYHTACVRLVKFSHFIICIMIKLISDITKYRRPMVRCAGFWHCCLNRKWIGLYPCIVPRVCDR